MTLEESSLFSGSYLHETEVNSARYAIVFVSTSGEKLSGFREIVKHYPA